MVPVLFSSLEGKGLKFDNKMKFIRTDFLLRYRVINFSHIVINNCEEINHVMDVEHLDTFQLNHEELLDEVIHSLEYKHDQW
jgi:hypothetical protein